METPKETPQETTPDQVLSKFHWCLLFLLAIIPLLFDRRIASPFILPQTLLARIGVGILLSAWLFLWSARKISIRFDSSLQYPVFGFTAACLIAAIHSPDHFSSFFGSYGLWFWGFWSVATYAGIFLLSANLAKYRERLVPIAMLCSFIVCVYAILQSLGLDPWLWRTSTEGRPSSTLGNANYMGGFTAMMVPICLYVCNKQSLVGKKIWFRIAGWILLAMNVYTCLLSQTRGAWLGLLGGILLWFLLLGKKEQGLRKKFFIIAALVAGIVILGTFTQYGKSQTAIRDRIKVFLNPKEGSAMARLSLWRSSLKIFWAHPIRGVGLDCFGYFFPRYQEVGHSRLGGKLMLATNAHNEPLQVAATTGIFGLGCYLWIWIALALTLIRRLKTAAPQERMLLASLAASCLALEIHSFFNFSVTATSLYLWCWLGTIAAPETTPQVKEQRQVPVLLRWALASACLVTLLFAGYRATRFYWADLSFKKGELAASPWTLEKAKQDYQKAIELDPRYYPAYTKLASIYVGLAKQLSEPAKTENYHKALETLKQAYEYFPLQPETPHNLGLIYLQISKDIREPTAEQAVTYLKEATLIAPQYPTFWNNYGRALEEAGQIEEAKKAWYHAIEINPYTYPAHENLGRYLPKKEVRILPQEILLTEVPLGTPIRVSDRAEQVFKLINVEDEDFKIDLKVVPWEETIQTMPDEYEAGQDNSWLTLDKNEFILKANEIQKIDGTLLIPNEKKYRHRKLILILFARIANFDYKVGTYAKLLIETK